MSQEDSRESDTLLAPSEPGDTAPPGPDDAEAERKMRTIIPAAGATPRELVLASDSLLLEAISNVAEAARDIRESRDERRATDARMEKLAQETHAAVLSADSTSQKNYEMLRLAISSQEKHIQSHTKRLAEGDERFGRIEKSIENLKAELLAHMDGVFKEYVGRIQALEDELEEARAIREAAATA